MVETVTLTPSDVDGSNASYNSYGLQLKQKLSPVERKIVAVLEEDGWKLSPDAIRHRIMEKYHIEDLSPGTIRPLCRSLTQRGIICNPDKGLYCDKLTYDVAVKPIAVHNIRLHCETSEDFEHWETTVEVGGAEIFVQFGERRGIISGWVKYDRGLNRPACMLALDKWNEIAQSHLGHKLPSNYFLTRLEVNRDEMGAKFDTSLHCATIDVLKDVIIQRVYEKADCLRQEYCVRKHMTPQQLDSLFLQGVDNFLASVAGHEQDKKLSGVLKNQQHMNEKLQDIDASNRAIQRKIIAESSGEDSAVRLIRELKDENSRTLAAMSSRFGEAMDLLMSRTVEVEELKRMVLSVVKSNADVAEALTKARQPEAVPSNEKSLGDKNDYVR